jgi:hypothetical protein
MHGGNRLLLPILQVIPGTGILGKNRHWRRRQKGEVLPTPEQVRPHPGLQESLGARRRIWRKVSGPVYGTSAGFKYTDTQKSWRRKNR